MHGADDTDVTGAVSPVELTLTGERTVPGEPAENYWFRRHEAAYLHVAGLVKHRDRVLEVGSGEGYGSAMLAAAGADVVGVDYDARAVAHSAVTYPTVRFVRANLAALPFASGSVDTVVTLQVIEHVWDHPGYLRECRRVLAHGGMLVVSTPNRLTFSPGRDTPLNPFHTHEFTAGELAGLMTAAGFALATTAGLHAAPRLAAHHDALVAGQLAAQPTQWPVQLSAAVAAVGSADFALRPAADADVDASLDLLFVARRVG